MLLFQWKHCLFFSNWRLLLFSQSLVSNFKLGFKYAKFCIKLLLVSHCEHKQARDSHSYNPFNKFILQYKSRFMQQNLKLTISPKPESKAVPNLLTLLPQKQVLFFTQLQFDVWMAKSWFIYGKEIIVSFDAERKEAWQKVVPLIKRRFFPNLIIDDDMPNEWKWWQFSFTLILCWFSLLFSIKFIFICPILLTSWTLTHRFCNCVVESFIIYLIKIIHFLFDNELVIHFCYCKFVQILFFILYHKDILSSKTKKWF